MAKMIPDTPPPPGPGARAERALYEALRARLSDEWFVLHGVDILDRERAAEGEIDFLLVHRVHGLLVIECKGDGVRRGSDGTWTRDRTDGAGVHADRMKSPFAQAQSQVKALVKELALRMEGAFPARFPFVHGHAVAFPLARVVEGGLPLDVARETVLLAEDLAQVDAWVERAAAFWRRAANPAPAPLEANDFTRFRKQVLQPKFHLVETLGARMRVEAEEIGRLSAEQLQVLRGCLDNRRLRVSGPAGCGKTALALEAARRFARDPGSSVLVACFNVGLAAHLADAARRSHTHAGRVDAMTFHDVCKRAYAALGRPFAPPAEPARAATFWNEEAPATLLDALAAGKAPRFDAIVVDEAQDFHADWWVVIEGCLRDADRGPLLVFEDPAQKIFDRKTGLPDIAASYSLTVNFRNTREIVKPLKKLVEVEMDSHARAPQGEPPTVLPMESPARVRDRVDDLVRRLLARNDVTPDQIVVLTPHTRPRSSLAGMTALGGLPLAGSPMDRAGRVLHTTISAFKGLESEVVILVDIDPEDSRCDARARYVGASRARHSLYVLARGEWA